MTTRDGEWWRFTTFYSTSNIRWIRNDNLSLRKEFQYSGIKGSSYGGSYEELRLITQSIRDDRSNLELYLKRIAVAQKKKNKTDLSHGARIYININNDRRYKYYK